MDCSTPALPVHHQLPEFVRAYLVAQNVKCLPAMQENQGSIPGLGKSPGEVNGNPLQYSCLENPRDGGAWYATVHGVAKNRTRLSSFTSLQNLFKLMSIESVVPSNHLILCRLLLLLPSIFPSIRVFSSEKVTEMLRAMFPTDSLNISKDISVVKPVNTDCCS